MVKKSGVQVEGTVVEIPLFTDVLYIQTVVGNGISEPSTVVSEYSRCGKNKCLSRYPTDP